MHWGLCGSAEEKVTPQHGEEQVRGPGGEHGGKRVYVAEILKDVRDDVVGDGYPDCGAKAGDIASFPCAKRERDGDDRHNEGDERVSQLAVELDTKAGSVEAGLLKVVDVTGEFVVTHLLRGAFFLFEIAGLFTDLGEAGY